MRALWLTVYSTLWLTSAQTYVPEKCIYLNSFDMLTINCSYRELHSVPHGIDQNVGILDLSHNAIEEYKDTRLFHFLTSIDLSFNSIRKAVFPPWLQSLECINLSGNHIYDLRHVEIQLLPKLSRMSLAHNIKLNKLSELSSRSLEMLDLSNCFIKTVDKNALHNLPRIKVLDLSFNSFRNIFNLHSETLEELDLSNGNLRFLTQNQLERLPNLKKLNISFNKVEDMYFTNDSECLTLTVIDASNSELKKLDNELSQFCYLEIVNVSSNHIKVIDELTFSTNLELVFLNLSFNQLEIVDKKAFIRAEKLHALDLSYNKIYDLGFTLYLSNIRFLNLSNNQIKNINNMHLKSVEELDLSVNKMYTIDDVFNKNIPRVTRLNMAFNPIEILSKVASESLRHLDLSYCQIITIKPDAFSHARELLTIDLTGNKLVALDYDIFAHNDKLKSLLLGHNPWSCNCNDAKFKSLYTYVIVNRSLSTGSDLHCYQQYSQTWQTVCETEWRSENLSLTSRKTFYSLLSTFIVALLIIGAVIFCRYLKDKKYNEIALVEPHRSNRESDDSERFTATVAAEPNRIRRSHSAADVPRQQNEVQMLHRSSTPPPNYEVALMLPKLSQEQEAIAMSVSDFGSAYYSEELS